MVTYLKPWGVEPDTVIGLTPSGSEVIGTEKRVGIREEALTLSQEAQTVS